MKDHRSEPGVGLEVIDVRSLADIALVDLAIRRNRDACSWIIQKHNAALYRVARGILGDDSDAEDAVQEAYLQAFAHLSSFRGDARLGTWLTKIAINTALAHLRSRRPASELEELTESDEHVEAQMLGQLKARYQLDPEAAAARAELRRVVEQAVDGLPDAFRVVFVMRDVHEMSVEETAEQLGLLPETVKTRLFRARRLLRSSLGNAVGDALIGAFPFGGSRCANMVSFVLAQLKI